MFLQNKQFSLLLMIAASLSSASAAIDLFHDDFQDDSLGTLPAITGSNVGDSYSPVAGSITVGANPETNGNTSSQVLRGGGVAANQNQIHALFDGGSTSIAGITVAFDFYVSSSAGNSSDGVRFGLYNEAGNNNGYFWRFDRVGASIGYLNTATGNTHAGSDIWQRFSVTYAAGSTTGQYDLAWSVTNLETSSVVASGTILGTNGFADGLTAGLLLEVNDTNNGNDFLGYLDNVLVTAPELTSGILSSLAATPQYLVGSQTVELSWTATGLPAGSTYSITADPSATFPSGSSGSADAGSGTVDAVIPNGQAETTFSIIFSDSTSTPLTTATASVSQFIPGEGPNILVILVDDMGWSDIGSYGGEIATPTLDSLAHTGIRFRHFYNEARCSPTRIALMTGLHMQQAGDNPNAHLPMLRHDNNITIPEVLRDHGYRTYFTGKWHLGDSGPQYSFNRGFMHCFGPGANASGAGGLYWPANTHQLVSLNNAIQPIQYGASDPRATEPYYKPHAITDYAVEYLNHHYQLNDGAPFFMYYAFNAPHFMIQAPKETINLYTDVGQDPATIDDVDIYRYEDGWDLTRQRRFERQLAEGIIGPNYKLSPKGYEPEGGRVIPDWVGASDSPNEAQRNDLARRMAVYAAMVHEIDVGIGRVVDRIREAGELDNTMIFFMSDNGGNSEGGLYGRTLDGSVQPGSFPLSGDRLKEMGQDGEPRLYLGGAWASVNNTPLRFFKKNTHEGGSRTPMVLHWPDGMNPEMIGQWTDERGHVIDVMATILDVLGIELPSTNPAGFATQPLAGTSLLPVLRGEILPERDLTVEHINNRALFRGKWKFVTKSFSYGSSDLPAHSLELYNLEVDPTELNNLAFHKTELLAEMVAAFNTWAAGMPGLNNNRQVAVPAVDTTTFAMPTGTELFHDTFSRADSADLDASRGGMSGTLLNWDLSSVDHNYYEGFGSADVAGSSLRMTAAEIALMHNLTGADITNAGGFSVQLDIKELNTATTDAANRFAGFGVGLTQAEAAAGNDISLPGSFRGRSDLENGVADCFVELDVAGNVKLWANGVLAGSANVGANAGTLLAAFEADGGFVAGSSVDATVYFNNIAVLATTFVWDHADANHLGLSARCSGFAELDNLTVRLLPLAGAQIQTYALQHGLEGSDTEQDADPDNDGVANWTEWAWGTNPASSDNPRAQALLIQTNGAGEVELLERQLAEDAQSGVQYRILYSNSLATPVHQWVELSPEINIVEPDPAKPGYKIRSLGLPPHLIGEERLFFVLQTVLQ